MKNSALSKEKQAKRALTIFFSVLCEYWLYHPLPKGE